MKDAIYQLWDGEMPQGERAGMLEMVAYAERIGAYHWFAENRRYFPSLPPAYGRFRVLYDAQFESLDLVVYADTDVWPVEGLSNNIVVNVDTDLALCTEPLQPSFRYAATSGICGFADEAWAKRMLKIYGVQLPRDSRGRLVVYNSGLQVWSAAGRLKARERFVSFDKYRKDVAGLKLHPLYASDQNYLHVMMFFAGLNVQELDNDWNRYVHFHPYPEISDQRTPTTKMVHVQLRGAGNWDREKLWRVVNRPQKEWRL